MIAAIIFFVFFLVVYLTRPNRKGLRFLKKPISKTYLKPTLEQARQQAMASFWVQAIAQSLPEKEGKAEIQSEPEIVLMTTLTEPKIQPVPQPDQPETPAEIKPNHQLSEKIISPLLASAKPEKEQEGRLATTNRSENNIPADIAQQADTYTAFVQYLKDFSAKERAVTSNPIQPAVEAAPKAEEPEPAEIDTSIIDINPEIKPIDYEEGPEGLVKYESDIPHWDHHYVYQASEINYANPAQQAFYRYFKKAFLNGIFLDLEDNTNYAFVLYFDLIQDYRRHKDIKQLEVQFKLLEKICERISSYSGNFLFNELKELGQLSDLGELEGAWSTLRNDRPTYLNWDWRSLYANKMKLSTEEVKLLEPIYLSSGAFMNIDFVCRQVIRLYIELVQILRAAYSQSGTSTEKEFAVILDLIARKQHHYHLDSPNYQYVVTHDNQLYAYILRYTESIIRAYYGYNRKLSIEGYLEHPEVRAIMQEKIIRHLEPRLPECYSKLEPLDEENEIELNAINPARWRSHIDPAIQSHLTDKSSGHLEKLVRLNQKNTSKDLLLFELCRMLIPIDKSEAIAYYFRHVYQSKQDKKVWKLPTSIMQKQLFKNAQEALPFNTFLVEYLKESDLEKALEFSKDYYKPVRKKINLDTQAIRQAEALDGHTTELLSAYLSDEEESKESVCHQEEIMVRTIEPIETQPITADPGIQTRVLLSNSALGLLKEFQNHNFELSVAEAETICKAYGMMAAPLINSINETCYDLLDENLIENEQTHYRIQPNYYYQIVNA